MSSVVHKMPWKGVDSHLCFSVVKTRLLPNFHSLQLETLFQCVSRAFNGGDELFLKGIIEYSFVFCFPDIQFNSPPRVISVVKPVLIENGECA